MQAEILAEEKFKLTINASKTELLALKAMMQNAVSPDESPMDEHIRGTLWNAIHLGLQKS